MVYLARGLFKIVASMKKMNLKRVFNNPEENTFREKISNNQTTLRRFKMKKLMMLVTAVVLATTGMSFGQSLSANGDATISARLLMGLSIAVTGGVDFGNQAITAGTITVAPASGAKFDVSGTGGTTVNLTSMPSTVTLTNTAPGSGTITFHAVLDVSSNGTLDDGGAAALLTAYNLVGTYPTTVGHCYFLLGGNIVLLGTENPGSYSGTYTLTAVYN